MATDDGYDTDLFGSDEGLEYADVRDFDASQLGITGTSNDWSAAYGPDSFMHPPPLPTLEPRLTQSPTFPPQPSPHHYQSSLYSTSFLPSQPAGTTVNQLGLYEEAQPATFMGAGRQSDTDRQIAKLLEENRKLKKRLNVVVSQSGVPSGGSDSYNDATIPLYGKKNKRTQNIMATAKKIQTKYLATLSPVFNATFGQAQNSWTSPATGFTFHYTRHGELDLGMKFTPDEIVDYTNQHQNHTLIGNGDTKSGGLTIWIQNTPADSSSRYPHKMSSKCRFASCPIPARTISKGDYRACFDEWAWSNDKRIDPFHNAGYAHLFCMEEQLDFGQVCQSFVVRGDTRHFRAEANKMAITRDYSEMLDIVDTYIKDAQPRPSRPDAWFEESLTKRLVSYHLTHEPVQRQGIRDARGGNSLDKHMGNLRVKMVNAAQIKEAKRRAVGKRRRDSDSDDSDFEAPRRKTRRSSGMGKQARRAFENRFYYTEEGMRQQQKLFSEHGRSQGGMDDIYEED